MNTMLLAGCAGFLGTFVALIAVMAFLVIFCDMEIE